MISINTLTGIVCILFIINGIFKLISTTRLKNFEITECMTHSIMYKDISGEKIYTVVISTHYTSRNVTDIEKLISIMSKNTRLPKKEMSVVNFVRKQDERIGIGITLREKEFQALNDSLPYEIIEGEGTITFKPSTV